MAELSSLAQPSPMPALKSDEGLPANVKRKILLTKEFDSLLHSKVNNKTGLRWALLLSNLKKEIEYLISKVLNNTGNLAKVNQFTQENGLSILNVKEELKVDYEQYGLNVNEDRKKFYNLYAMKFLTNIVNTFKHEPSFRLIKDEFNNIFYKFGNFKSSNITFNLFDLWLKQKHPIEYLDLNGVDLKKAFDSARGLRSRHQKQTPDLDFKCELKSKDTTAILGESANDSQKAERTLKMEEIANYLTNFFNNTEVKVRLDLVVAAALDTMDFPEVEGFQASVFKEPAQTAQPQHAGTDSLSSYSASSTNMGSEALAMESSEISMGLDAGALREGL